MAQLSATEAAQALAGLRSAHDDVNRRAIGLSLMVWALIFTSAAGSLVMLNFATMRDMAPALWILFILASIASVGLWVALGGVIQNMLWQAFPGSKGHMHPRSPWRAAGVAFGLVVLTYLVSGWMQSWHGPAEPTEETAYMHNITFSFALGVGGAVIVAVTMLVADGIARRRGFTIGLAMVALGPLSMQPWVPEVSIAGPLLAIAAVPLAFLTIGYTLWQRS